MLRATAASFSSSAAPRASRRAASSSAWPSKTHLRPAPSLPPPVPAQYAQKVVLSDGSTFTSYTTAPTPAILRLTRDVTNNPLWAPGTEKRGIGEGAGAGRVGRFRRRFEAGDVAGGVDAAPAAATPAAAGSSAASASSVADDTASKADEGGVRRPARTAAFGEADLSWMSEGAREETLTDKAKGISSKAKGGKKK